MAEIDQFAGPLKQWAWEVHPPEAKVSPVVKRRKEGRKWMEEGKELGSPLLKVMGALFRADHGRPGKALPRSHA